MQNGLARKVDGGALPLELTSRGWNKAWQALPQETALDQSVFVDASPSSKKIPLPRASSVLIEED